MTDEKMIRMVNQIATFFATQPDTDRAGKVAAHIMDFWDPTMRAQLVQFAQTDGAGLDPIAMEAAQSLTSH